MLNFLAAAQRHLDDGDLLHRHARAASTVQFWAYGAECVLKAISLSQGHFALNSTGIPTNGFGLHLNQTGKNGSDLLSLYNAAQAGTSALMGPTSAFAGWEIAARYHDGTQLQPLSRYFDDAQCFRNLLNSALVHGILP